MIVDSRSPLGRVRRTMCGIESARLRVAPQIFHLDGLKSARGA